MELVLNPSKTVVNNKDGSGIQTSIYYAFKMTADVKSINIKNRRYYFFNDIINIEGFGSSLLKIGTKSYKNIDMYYIGYITIKKLMIMKISIV